jgi:hypothetical protein
LRVRAGKHIEKGAVTAGLDGSSRSIARAPMNGTPGLRTISARCGEHDCWKGNALPVFVTRLSLLLSPGAHVAVAPDCQRTPRPVFAARSARRHPVSCSQDVDVLADAVGRELGCHFGGGDPASGAAGGSMLAEPPGEPPCASVVVPLAAGGGVTSTLVAGVSAAGFSTAGSAGLTGVSALVGAFARCRG